MSSLGQVSELESLRLQVADLTRELAARDQSMQVQQQSFEHVVQNLRVQSDLLKAIMEGTAADTGDEFFASLATHLTASLHMQYVVIGEIVAGTPVTIRTVAVASGGTLLDNFEYDLTQAPCGTALTESFWCYGQGVQALFPHFPPLATLGVESHAGVSIRNKQGEAVGLIVVMDTKPITSQEQLQALLRVFAPRVAAELQRTHTETAFREQTLRLAHAQALAHLGSWDWEIGSGRMEWSDEQFRIFGHEPGAIDATHEAFLAAVLPDDYDRVSAAMNATLVDQTPFDLECRIVRPDGEVRVIHARGEVYRDATGRPIGMDGTVLDITTGKRAEQALAEKTDELSDFIEHATVSMHWVGPDGIILWANQTELDLLGYTREEYIGRPIADFHVDQPVIRDILNRLCHAEKVQEYAARLRSKDGSIKDVLIDSSVFWKDGQFVHTRCFTRNITERRHAEEALRESEARSRSIIETALDAVVAIDKDGHIIGWNPQAEATFGYSAQEAIGRDLSETIIPVQFRQAHAAGVQRVFQSGENPRMKRRLEVSALHRDGHEFPAEFAMALTHVSGQPVLSAFVRDITERKRAEESVRESEERFDLAVRGSNTGIWDWDLRTNKTYFSPLWKSMLGYEAHELQGEFSEWEERLHPDDRERSLATVHAYLNGDLPQYELQHRLRHKDGSYRWILARGVSTFDAEGNPYRMAGSHIDITEQKQTQETLSQREEQLRTVLNALPVGVWCTDATGNVRLTNPAGCRIWAGVQQVGLEGTEGHPGWWEQASSSGAPHRWALARALTKGEATLNEELTIQCLDGAQKVIINSAVPLFGEAGQVSGAIIVNQDITERKALERDRAQTQAFLQSILENIPHIITVKDAKTLKILQVNRAAEQVLGADRHALAGKTLYDCLNEQEADALWAADIEAFQRRTLVEVPEHVVKRERERDRIFQTKKVPIFDAEGEPQHILTISEDITARKQAEEALRQSADRLSLATRAGGVGVWDWDLVQNRLTWDDQMFTLYGITRDCFSGTYEAWKAGVLPEDLQQADAQIQMALRGEKDFDTEFRVLWPNGTIRNIRALTAVTRDASGRPLRMIGMNWDITDRKSLEEALRRREQDLCVAIEERERISQDLHDGILQSLFAVGLGLEASKSTVSVPNRLPVDASLDQAIKQLNRVISEIRNFIQGLGSDPLQGRDLPTALQHMVASLTQNQSTHVRLAIEDRATRAVSPDHTLHVFHVIQEAVSNCIRHGRAQEAMVSLKLLKQGVRLSIRDNGCGFNPECAKGNGHGLLNMAARAQKIGGRFTVFSKINKGTRVVFDLPKEAARVRR